MVHLQRSVHMGVGIWGHIAICYQSNLMETSWDETEACGMNALY